MLIVLVCAIGGAEPDAAKKPPAPSLPPAPVTAAKVLQRKLASGQTFVGTVMPSRKSIVGSAVDGRVVEYLAQEGDFVKKGDVLARLLTGTIEIELAAAEAELKLRRAELDELTNGSRLEEVKLAAAHMKGMKARLAYAEARSERVRNLFEKRTLSKDEMDEANSAAESAMEAFHEAEATWKLVSEGPRKEKIAQQKAKVLMQQEEVHRIEDRIEKYTIKAYFDGYILKENTEVGHWVKQGDAIAEVAALDPVDVRILVLENFVEHLSRGTDARVEIGALAGREFFGAVEYIVPQADHRSRSFPVDVRLRNPVEKNGPLVKAGMFAHVTLAVGKEEDALLVPKDAVVLGGPSPLVYVVRLDPKDPERHRGKVAPVPVQLGVANSGWIQVLGPGLSAGDVVVVRGNERLRPEQEVQFELLPENGIATPVKQAASK